MKTYGTGSRTARLGTLVAALVAAGTIPSIASAQSGSWSQTATGLQTWGNAANWTGGVIANGANNTATFATAGLTAGEIINLDTPRTIGALVFDNPTNSFGWTIQGTNALTLSNSGGPTITVANTGGTATAPVTATISAPVIGTFTKAGAGNLILTANNTGLTGVNVSAGLVNVTASSGVNPLGTGTVTLSGGTLQLGDASGYTQRMVVPVGSTFANANLTATMDGGTSLAGNTWYALGQNTAAPMTGVPNGTVISQTSSISYNVPVPDTTHNNAMLLDTSHTTGKFVLATPTSGLSSISFLTSAGNGTSPNITATIHYTDGTPDATGIFNSPDWFGTGSVAVAANGRINSGGYANVTNPPTPTSPPFLFDATITNPNPGSTIGSISLSYDASGGPSGNHVGILGVSTAVAAPTGAQTFTNAVSVTADSTIDLETTATSALGNLSIGTNNLSVTSTGLGTGNLTLGAVAMSGNPTFTVGAGVTTTLGALSDGGTVRTVTVAGPGTLTAAAAASSLQPATGLTVTGGTLNINNGTAFGPSPAVTLNGGITNLGVGTNPTFGSLAGTGGSLVLNGNTVTVGNSTSTTFSGGISNGSAPGSVVKVGTGTLTVNGASSYSGGTTITAGTVVAGAGTLGTGAINMAGGTLAVQPQPAITISGFGGTGTGWTQNGNSMIPSPDVWQATPATGGTSSIWYNTRLPTRPFTINFTLTNLIGAAADGITVGFQNSAAGLTALGGGGGSLGWAGISPSAAFDLDIYGPNTSTGAGSGAALRSGGVIINPVPSTNPVNFGAQNQPTNFTLTYDGTNATIALNQPGVGTYNSGPQPFNFASFVGSSAIFGFTGATGGVLSQLQVSNFTFTSPQAPATYANAVNVTSSSTIQVTAPTGVPTVTMGVLTMSPGATLSVTPDPTNPAGNPFGLTFASTTLNGADTFNISNTAAGTGTLTMGPVSSAGPGASLTVIGGGNLVASGGTISGNLNLGTSPLNMSGVSLAVGSLTGTGGSITGNGGTATTPITLTIGSDNTSPAAYAGVIADGTGVLALVKTGQGTLTLSGTNTYSGGTTVLDGTLAISSDASTGSGPVTLTNLATLSYAANTSTSKSYTLGGGTLAVGPGATLTVNGGVIAGGFLGGSGNFSTDPVNGSRFANDTSLPSVTITSNSPSDRFVNFVNGGKLNVAAGVSTGGATTTLLNSFTNEGSGSFTVGAGSRINVANFQSSGMMTMNPATSPQLTLLTNVGNSPLSFEGGSQTFIGTPATASQNVTALDLHGQNLTVTGGLFVNNGFVADTVGGSSIFVNYGALYKGAGTNFVPVVTQNGGKFQAGNSPGISVNGSLVLGPGGLGNFGWQINDAGPSTNFPSAPGVSGPTPDAMDNVSGWSLLEAAKVLNPLTGQFSTGNLNWTAMPVAGSQFLFSLETLLGPKTAEGQSPDGAMADFDKEFSYTWRFLTYAGTYTGPQDIPGGMTADQQLTADTLIDTSAFANAVDPNAKWSLHLVQTPGGMGGEIDLLYTVPEPGTLALGSLAGLGLGWVARRRKAKRAVAA